MENYSEKVMDHFRNPRNVGEIENPDGIGHVGNPVCVTSGTLVLCNKDKKPIENIIEGMRVLSHDGKYHKVKRVFRRQYNGKVYKIFVHKIGSITITPEHHVLSIRDCATKAKNESFVDWCTASELTIDNILLFPISREKGNKNKYRLNKWNRDYYYSTIRKIDLLDYEGEVCNLEVEDTRSYVTESATLHNCGDIMELYIKVENDVIIDAKFKTFGCLPKDSKIVLSEGSWGNISNIKKGSSVVNSDGRSTLASEIFTENYQGSLINIIPFVSPYNSFSTTPEHPIFCIKRSSLDKARRASHKCEWLQVDKKELLKKRPDYVMAKDIEKSDYLIFNVNRKIRDNPRFTKDLMRLIGYYLAEGYLSAKGGVVAFAFNKSEQKTAKKLKSLITSIINKEPKERIRANVREIYVCSTKLANFLKTCAGSLAKNKTLSKKIMLLPFEKQKELIKTYLIGDGNFYRRRPGNSFTYRASTVSSLLAIQMQEMLARGGIFASIKKIYKPGHIIEGRKMKASYAYLIRFQLEREHNFVHRANGYFLVPVRKVERKPFKGRIYNFQVESEPNSYLVRGFAVHNCGAAIATSSMVTELVKGKTVDEALKISNRAVAEALGGLPPIKMHCSMLAEEALKSAIADYLKKKDENRGA